MVQDGAGPSLLPASGIGPTPRSRWSPCPRRPDLQLRERTRQVPLRAAPRSALVPPDNAARGTTCCADPSTGSLEFDRARCATAAAVGHPRRRPSPHGSPARLVTSRMASACCDYQTATRRLWQRDRALLTQVPGCRTAKGAVRLCPHCRRRSSSCLLPRTSSSEKQLRAKRTRCT